MHEARCHISLHNLKNFSRLVVFYGISTIVGYLMPNPLYIYIFFIIQHVKARVIPCPHQLPTRGDNTVLVAQGSTMYTYSMGGTKFN